MADLIEKLDRALNADRVLGYCWVLIAVLIGSTFYVLWANGGNLPNGSPMGSDYVSFWTAARETVSGQAARIYDPSAFHSAQEALFPSDEKYAFFYPPHYLLVLAPAGLVPYYVALALWLLATFALAAALCIRITGETGKTLLILLAFPATYLTVVHGQNAFLSAALFGCGLLYLTSRPILAGVCFGLLTFKPQLGLLIPFVLLAGGHWRTIGSAVFTTVALILVSGLILGAEAWFAFLGNSDQAMTALRNGDVAWSKMISLYAALRVLGMGHEIALTVHGGMALGVAGWMVLIWWRGTMAVALKYTLTLTAVLLVTPFGLSYDLFVLAPAFAWLATYRIQNGFYPGERTVLAVMFVMPLALLALMPAGLPIAPFFLLGFFLFVARSPG